MFRAYTSRSISRLSVRYWCHLRTGRQTLVCASSTLFTLQYHCLIFFLSSSTSVCHLQSVVDRFRGRLVAGCLLRVGDGRRTRCRPRRRTPNPPSFVVVSPSVPPAAAGRRRPEAVDGLRAGIGNGTRRRSTTSTALWVVDQRGRTETHQLLVGWTETWSISRQIRRLAAFFAWDDLYYPRVKMTSNNFWDYTIEK